MTPRLPRVYGGAVVAFTLLCTTALAGCSPSTSNSQSDQSAEEVSVTASPVTDQEEPEPDPEPSFLNGAVELWTLDFQSLMREGESPFLALYPEIVGSTLVTATYENIFGFAPESGELKWEVQKNSEDCVASVSQPTITCGWAYGGKTVLTEYDADTGEIVNTASLDNAYYDLRRLLSVDDGWILVGYQDAERVSRNGDLLWAVGLPEPTEEFAAAKIENDYLLLQSLGRGKVVDLATGEQLFESDLWSSGWEGGKTMSLSLLPWEEVVFQDDPIRRRIYNPPVAVETTEGTAWFFADHESMSRLNPATGEPLWTINVASSQAMEGMPSWILPTAVVSGDEERVIWAITNDEDETLLSSVKLDGTDPISWVSDISIACTSSCEYDPIYIDTVGAAVVHARGPQPDFYVPESVQNTVFGFDPFTGTPVWKIEGNRYLMDLGPEYLALLSLEENTDFPYPLSLTIYRPALPGEATATIPLAGQTVNVDVDKPDMIPDCPGDTQLLSWAELANGWILVCGVSESEPTYWLASLGSEQYESDAVTWGDSGGSSGGSSDLSPWYEATLPDGQVMRLDFSPSSFRIVDADGQVSLQTSVLLIYFVNMGIGRPGENTGAFGLTTPEDTADDQVRYLASLLELSYEGREALVPVVESVRECPNTATLQQDIEVIRSVRDNRSYLLNALASTPVDQIPEGTQLLNELQVALSYSYQADVGYLEWAEGILANGCGPAATVGDQNSISSRPYKEAFSERWNRVIYPSFDVQRIDPEKL